MNEQNEKLRRCRISLIRAKTIVHVKGWYLDPPSEDDDVVVGPTWVEPQRLERERQRPWRE